MGARYRNQGENAAPGKNELPEKTGKEIKQRRGQRGNTPGKKGKTEKGKYGHRETDLL